MPELNEEFGGLRENLLGQTPRPIREGVAELGTELKKGFGNLRDDLLQRDQEFDTAGVPDYGLRAGLSRMDTPAERKRYLDKWLGPEGWTQDKYGSYALTPSGMDTIHLPHKNRPVLIDEPWNLTRYDIADITGEAPAIAGATAAGIATGGLSFIPGTLAVVAGEILGKAAGEIVEEIRGENLQTFPEVAADALKQGAYAAGGEVVSRGLLAVGRKAMAPNVGRMTPERTAAAQQARELGAQPSVTQIVRPPLLGRAQSMMNLIFGDPLAVKNARAITKEMNRLKTSIKAPSGTKLSVGERITKDISRARGALSRWSSRVASQIDEMAGGMPVVPTTRIKEQAQEILGSLPRTTGGDVVFAQKELIGELENVMNLPEFFTTQQMQQVTERLFSAISDETIVPGIGRRHARMLWKSATESYADIADDNLRDVVLRFRDRYRREITRFDNALVERVMRSPKYAGRLEPEQIVGAIFRKGQSSKLSRIKNVVTPATWDRVQLSAMDDVLGKISRRTDDPFEEIFTGKEFLNSLDAYGKDTLNATFGKGLTSELYRLGNVTQFVTQQMKMSGGIVAASIALHPLKNLGRIVHLNVMSRFLNTPFAVRWLTEGLKAPNTRRGSAAITRLSVFIKALAEEHTQDPATDKPVGVPADKL